MKHTVYSLCQSERVASDGCARDGETECHPTPISLGRSTLPPGDRERRTGIRGNRGPATPEMLSLDMASSTTLGTSRDKSLDFARDKSGQRLDAASRMTPTG
jgi:hypothetical protein